jgi:hypothetical protein
MLDKGMAMANGYYSTSIYKVRYWNIKSSAVSSQRVKSCQLRHRSRPNIMRIEIEEIFGAQGLGIDA